MTNTKPGELERFDMINNVPGIEDAYMLPDATGEYVRYSDHVALISKLTAERDAWKAGHDEMVRRNAVLRDRPDLPTERLKSYQAMIARIEVAEKELSDSRKRIQELEMELWNI